VIIAPPTADTVAAVTFDGTASTSDAGISNFHWEMGDGTVMEMPVFQYTYTQPGNFTVTLTVMDAYGQTGSTTWDIMVYAAVEAPPEVTQPIATPPPAVSQPIATPTP
jgi:PKD repeat protein